MNDHTDPTDVQSRHDRQRRRRGWYRHRLSNGNSALTFHGDDESIDHMERCVKAQADVEYRNDGGRDLATGKHPRTRDQRGFDAAHTLLTGNGTDQDAGTGGKAKPSRSSKAQNRRAIIFVKATVDQLTGIDPSVITTADGKPLPHSVVEQLAKNADYIGQIFSTRGELLWQGRKTRLATPSQVFGLIARDGGCVRCGTHHDNCVAHHLLPYEAPGRGETRRLFEQRQPAAATQRTRPPQRQTPTPRATKQQTTRTRSLRGHRRPATFLSERDGAKAATAFSNSSGLRLIGPVGAKGRAVSRRRLGRHARTRRRPRPGRRSAETLTTSGSSR